MSNTTEVRFEVPKEEVSVLDGYCQATGKDRSKVIRDVLRQWSEQKRHEAILICRVAGCNPTEPVIDRRTNRTTT
jgi:metal-responsive CopG/Arc/MetJ family transcriptional regulator